MNEHLTDKTEFIVEPSDEDFSKWISRSYIPDSLKGQLARANVLIVPNEGFREHLEPVFPVGTEELLNFLRDNAGVGIVPDICIADEDYKELALHGALIILGSFIVTSLVAPVIANLISDYIRKRWPAKQEDAEVKVELTVVGKDNRASRLLYEGPAKDFNKTVRPTLEKLAAKDVDSKKNVVSDSNKGIKK